MTRKILLWGGGRKARILEAMIAEAGLGDVAIIFDNTLAAPPFETRAIFINDVSELKKRLGQLTHQVVCIGSEHGYARWKTAACLAELGLRPITLVHDASFIDPTATLGEGCQVMPRAVVHKFTKIGEQSILNTNCVIDHDCVVGKGVHVMGAAAIAGMVEIGDFATIGTNATVFPYVKIGEGAFIGAGALVRESVEPYTVHVGVPARFSRKIEPKFYEDALIELRR